MGADILQQHRLEVVPYLLISIELRRIGGERSSQTSPSCMEPRKDLTSSLRWMLALSQMTSTFFFAKAKSPLRKWTIEGPLNASGRKPQNILPVEQMALMTQRCL